MLEPNPRSTLEIHAASILAAAYVLSILYELWRSTAKAGVSRHDTMQGFLLQLAGLYLPAALVIGALFLGLPGAAGIGLVFTTVLILVSTLYYNPVIMAERQPGMVDWVEDIAYTGLHFIAAALLLYQIAGWALVAS